MTTYTFPFEPDSEYWSGGQNLRSTRLGKQQAIDEVARALNPLLNDPMATARVERTPTGGVLIVNTVQLIDDVEAAVARAFKGLGMLKRL